MMHSWMFVRTVSLALCFVVGACTNQKVSPATRAAIRTAQIVNPPNGAEAKLYADQTNATAAAIGPAFGLIGGLLAAGVMASNTKSGLQRWETVVASKRTHVLARVREHAAREFGRAAGIRFTEKGVTDAQLVFDRIEYGVQHDGDQRFVAAISAFVQMKRSSGKSVWRGMTIGLSTKPRTLEEFQRDPRAYEAALDEAAAKLGQQLASYY